MISWKSICSISLSTFKNTRWHLFTCGYFHLCYVEILLFDGSWIKRINGVRQNAGLLSNIIYQFRSQDNSVECLHYGPDVLRSIPDRARDFFSLLPRSDQFWGPLSLLSNGYIGWGGGFRGGRGLNVWGVKLSTHLHPSPRLRTREAILPLPHTYSWRGA
jgi:hypothetical protein